MTKPECDELYRKVYDAYDYAALKDEHTRASLGDILDHLIVYSQRFVKPN